jgi:hypothetical protein
MNVNLTDSRTYRTLHIGSLGFERTSQVQLTTHFGRVSLASRTYSGTGTGGGRGWQSPQSGGGPVGWKHQAYRFGYSLLSRQCGIFGGYWDW